jgi:hypothetical protein
MTALIGLMIWAFVGAGAMGMVGGVTGTSRVHIASSGISTSAAARLLTLANGVILAITGVQKMSRLLNVKQGTMPVLLWIVALMEHTPALTIVWWMGRTVYL